MIMLIMAITKLPWYYRHPAKAADQSMSYTIESSAKHGVCTQQIRVGDTVP